MQSLGTIVDRQTVITTPWLQGVNDICSYNNQPPGAAFTDMVIDMLGMVTDPVDRAAIIAGTSTTDHTALFTAALALGTPYISDGRWNVNDLTIPARGRGILGSGVRACLHHFGSGTAITVSDSSTTIFPGGAPAYINDGQFRLDNFSLYFNGPVGIELGKTRTTGSTVSRMYIKPTAYFGAMTNSTYVAGTAAISCNNKSTGPQSTYGISVRDCQIAGCESMAYINETVNLWEFDNVYTIDCLNYAKLSADPGSNPGVGKIRFNNGYCESGIAAARGIVFGSGGGTSVVISNMTFELTNAAATQYAFDFTAGGNWTQCAVMNCTYLIQNDGNAVNSRRITGSPPADLLEFNRNYTSSLYNTIPMDWRPGANTAQPRQLSNFSRLGGFQQGAGTLFFGRSDTDGADSVLTQDASGNLLLQAANNVNLVSGNHYVNATLTGAPAQGATSATLTANWTNPTGNYNVMFSTGDVRLVTLTNGATTATWSVGLSAAAATAITAFGVFSTKGWRMNGSSFALEPITDNAYSFGEASNRGTSVWATSGVVSTSDRRHKRKIRKLKRAERAVGKRLKELLRVYQWKVKSAPNPREAGLWQIGWIAQDVIEAFAAEGLDALQYGCILYYEWEAKPAVYDRAGQLMEPARSAGNIFSVRETQLIAFILGAL